MSTGKGGGDIPIVAGVAPLQDGVEAWICDIWGVVHNGLAAFKPAVEACQRFRVGGGVVLLLTNAPRPASAIYEQLGKLAVPRDAYDAVLTSGDLTRHLIEQNRALPMMHLGPERDRGLFDGLDPYIADADGAGIIICSGLYDDERETAEDYRQRLTGPLRRGVKMVCANPDITVARGSKVIPCAGAIAQLYEQMGGEVIYAGKPHLPVYERAFEMVSEAARRPIGRERMLAIGDGVHTDMLGAANAGLRAVFVASPVHIKEPLSPAVLARAFAGAPRKPVAAMSALAW